MVYLIVREALVGVEVEHEHRVSPLKNDHLVILVLPADITRIGRQPALLFLCPM